MAASMRLFTRFPQILVKISQKLSIQTHIDLQTHILLTRGRICTYHQRRFSLTSTFSSNSQELPPTEVKKLMERLTDKFSEARELMDDARESKGTVYFSDDMKEAQEAVEETLTEYRQFLEKLSDKQRQDVIASLGLRMEELKAQRAAMEEEIKHDD